MSDPHLLTGAYALDALDDVERAGVERHLRGCAECAAEVAEFHEVPPGSGAVAVSAHRRLGQPGRSRRTPMNRLVAAMLAGSMLVRLHHQQRRGDDTDLRRRPLPAVRAWAWTRSACLARAQPRARRLRHGR